MGWLSKKQAATCIMNSGSCMVNTIKEDCSKERERDTEKGAPGSVKKQTDDDGVENSRVANRSG